VRRDLLPALGVAVAGTLILGAAAAAGWLKRWPEDRSFSWSSVTVYAAFTVAGVEGVVRIENRLDFDLDEQSSPPYTQSRPLR
jgi:hypothetical protein